MFPESPVFSSAHGQFGVLEQMQFAQHSLVETGDDPTKRLTLTRRHSIIAGRGVRSINDARLNRKRNIVTRIG